MLVWGCSMFLGFTKQVFYKATSCLKSWNYPIYMRSTSRGASQLIWGGVHSYRLAVMNCLDLLSEYIIPRLLTLSTFLSNLWQILSQLNFFSTFKQTQKPHTGLRLFDKVFVQDRLSHKVVQIIVASYKASFSRKWTLQHNCMKYNNKTRNNRPSFIILSVHSLGYLGFSFCSIKHFLLLQYAACESYHQKNFF